MRIHIAQKGRWKGQPVKCPAEIQCTLLEPDGSSSPHFDSKDDAKAFISEVADKESGGAFGSAGHRSEKKQHAKKRELARNIDVQLAELYDREERAKRKFENRRYDLHSLAGDAKFSSYWTMSHQEAYKIAAEKNPDHEAVQYCNKVREELNGIYEEVKELDKVYAANGGWNRAFIVNNNDGHVHSHMNCSTCNKGKEDTTFEWQPELSGADEKEIVEAAGWRACTVCYPSAPVGTKTSLPSKLSTKDEREKAEAAEEKRIAQEAKKVKAAADAPTIEGKPIEVHDYGFMNPAPKTLKTERAAMMWFAWSYTDETDPMKATDEKHHRRIVENNYVIEKIAEKRGVDPAVVREEAKKRWHKNH